MIKIHQGNGAACVTTTGAAAGDGAAAADPPRLLLAWALSLPAVAVLAADLDFDFLRRSEPIDASARA